MTDRLSFDDICHIMQSRRMSDGPTISRMNDVLTRFNGDLVIPLADIPGEPTLSQPTPNLIADAIESTSMRAASTTPITHCPALDPSKVTSVARAATRRRAIYSTWDYSALLETILPRSYRHLAGYGTNCLVVVPDFEAHRARIEIRNPLSAYPESRSPDDTREPRNIGHIYGRSAQWIINAYPEASDFFEGKVRHLHRTRPSAVSGFWDTLWDVVEWIDEQQIVMGVLGPREQASFYSDPSSITGGNGFHLRTWDNKAGMVTVAMPRRVTLDRIDGQVTKLTGLVDMMGKLMALDVEAAERAVFSDFVIMDANGTPQLLNASGHWNDGRSGQANLVKGSSVQMLQNSPGPLTHPVIDRLERNFRVSGGLPGFSSGENDNSLRSGNALSTMSGISIDPRIQEMQRLMTRGLKVVNEATVAVFKGYFPNRKSVFFSGWPGDFGHVTFTPSEDFDSKENAVNYAFPGTDINQLTVAIGNAAGLGLISKKSGRAKHPLVDDPDAEERHIIAEQIEEAAMATFIQQAQMGSLPLIDLARIYKGYQKTGSWVEAIEDADKEARARQAAQPATPTALEAMPGLAMPGDGAEAMGAPPPDQMRPDKVGQFEQLVQALNVKASPALTGVPTG